MIRRWLLVMVALVALAGCRTDLYTDFSEREANEMMAALLQHGISAQKAPLRDNLFALSVGNADVSEALVILDNLGLPRRNRQSIGEVFQRAGMISSPFEERVRYVHALGEELAQTLQQIDGILVARVHIVLPEEPGLGQQARPSSAAVVIRQRQGYDLEFLTPQIRRLVSSSIEGVEYEAVTVVLVEAQPTPRVADGARSDLNQVLPGIVVHQASVGTFWTIAGGLGAVTVALLLATALLAWRLVRGGRKRASAEGDGDLA
jgi:type III secretion protein J